MVTAAASERGAGIDPAVVAVAPRVPLPGPGGGDACTAGAGGGEPLRRGDGGRPPPPEDRGTPPELPCRSIVQGSAERTDVTGRSRGGAHGGDPVRRDAAGCQPAENDQLAR